MMARLWINEINDVTIVKMTVFKSIDTYVHLVVYYEVNDNFLSFNDVRAKKTFFWGQV